MAVSSLWDCSKHFTLHLLADVFIPTPLDFLGKHSITPFYNLHSCGSVLGPILFLTYINYLEDDISSKVLKFADDTKVFRKVTNVTDKQSLQDDLDKLVK